MMRFGNNFGIISRLLNYRSFTSSFPLVIRDLIVYAISGFVVQRFHGPMENPFYSFVVGHGINVSSA